MMDGGMMGAMGVWAILAILVMLAVLVVAALAGIWLIRRLFEDDHDSMVPGDGGAYEVLRRRYASGEIDDEEYERRLAVLDRR